MMRYAYFPGCSAHSTGISYTKSTAYVTSKIGFEMEEIPDWSCCGTSAARLTSFDLGNALPARSMALSEQAFPELDVVAPCAGCYQALKASVNYSRQSEENLAEVQEMIQLPYEAKADVVSLLEAFSAPDVKDALAAKVEKPLNTLKVACYYGCAMVRPASVCNFDNPEDPQSMDEIMTLIGAEPIDWAFKNECCGASTQMTTLKASRPLIERIFQNAAANGAECIVTACPLCWLNLDMREDEINKSRAAAGKSTFDMPVYYFTELIGLAFGGGISELGIDKHFRPSADFLARKEKEAEDARAAAAAAAEEAERKAREREARIAAKKAEKEKAAKEKAADAAKEKAADAAKEKTVPAAQEAAVGDAEPTPTPTPTTSNEEVAK